MDPQLENVMNMKAKTPDELEAEADALITGQSTAPEGDTPPPPQDDEHPETPPQGDEPPTADEPPGGDEPTDDEPAPEDDDLKGLSVANAEERIRNAQARMTKATQEASELRKQIQPLTEEVTFLRGQNRDLQRQIDELKAAAKATPASEPAPTVTDDEMKNLVSQYPDLAPLAKVVDGLKADNAKLAARNDALEARLNKTAQSFESQDDKAAKAAHLKAILDVHPDAQKLRNSDDFKGWLERQAPVIRDAMDHGTAADVNFVFDTYKEAVGMKTRRGKIGTAAAAADPSVRTRHSAPTGNEPLFTHAQIAAMSQEEFARREEEIDKAIAAGRVA